MPKWVNRILLSQNNKYKFTDIPKGKEYIGSEFHFIPAEHERMMNAIKNEVFYFYESLKMKIKFRHSSDGEKIAIICDEATYNELIENLKRDYPKLVSKTSDSKASASASSVPAAVAVGKKRKAHAPLAVSESATKKPCSGLAAASASASAAEPVMPQTPNTPLTPVSMLIRVCDSMLGQPQAPCVLSAAKSGLAALADCALQVAPSVLRQGINFLLPAPREM